MPPRIFQPNQCREEAKQLLREGVSPEECATRFSIGERTAYRYLKEVQDEKAGKAPPGKRTASSGVILPGVTKEAFTPAGIPLPAEPPKKEFLHFGNLNMPMEDWGYSSYLNIFIVASTFVQARREYKFDSGMKVGDFCAHLCQAFRMMKGWDVKGAGYAPVKIIEKESEAK